MFMATKDNLGGLGCAGILQRAALYDLTARLFWLRGDNYHGFIISKTSDRLINPYFIIYLRTMYDYQSVLTTRASPVEGHTIVKAEISNSGW
jgi:hypothetical protein